MEWGTVPYFQANCFLGNQLATYRSFQLSFWLVHGFVLVFGALFEEFEFKIMFHETRGN